MKPISESTRTLRVMVVDDSPVTRRLVERVIARADGLELVAELDDGHETMEVAAQCEAEVLILDLELPDMDSREILNKVHGSRQRLGVVIYTGASDAAVEALEADLERRLVFRVMRKGAASEGGIKRLRERLVPLVREVGVQVRTGSRGPKAPLPAAPTPNPLAARNESDSATARGPLPSGTPRRSTRVGVVVVGASTGGPDALMKVLAELPADLPVPVVLVQHMPVGFTQQLADQFDSYCAITVGEASDGKRLVAGNVLVAPGGRHLEIHRDGPHLITRLTEAEPENSCRPAVDVLFRSAAAATAKHTLAVVLTGMGHDGLAGAKGIRRAGGTVIVQDEATSAVWGMPGSIVKAGEADEVLPLADIGARILEVARSGRNTRRVTG